MRLPYELRETIFKKVSIERPHQMPDDYMVEVSIEAKVVENPETPNRLEIHIRLKSTEETLPIIDLDHVGLFERTDHLVDLSEDEKRDFIEQHALHILFPYLRQMIHSLTNQMGMKAVKLNSPAQYAVERLLEPAVEEE